MPIDLKILDFSFHHLELKHAIIVKILDCENFLFHPWHFQHFITIVSFLEFIFLVIFSCSTLNWSFFVNNCSERTRVLLMSAAYVHLKHCDISKHTRNLSPASRAILLSGPTGMNDHASTSGTLSRTILFRAQHMK